MFPQIREEVWSGAGSNRRPSAFQRAYASAGGNHQFTATSLLTCINGLLGLTKPYYQPCRLVPDKTVLSVGFLWGTPFQTDGCGDSVGNRTPHEPRSACAWRRPYVSREQIGSGYDQIDYVLGPGVDHRRALQPEPDIGVIDHVPLGPCRLTLCPRSRSPGETGG